MTSRTRLYIAGYAAFAGSAAERALRAQGYQTRLTPGLATPGLATPGLATPGLAAPGLAAPGLAAPDTDKTESPKVVPPLLIAAMTASPAPSSAAGGAMRSFPALLDQIEAWRAAGLCIGFTNGCFDILHPGHMALFGVARAASDRLVVGLNSDASVRRLKGPARPVNDERARATALAALDTVDAVAIFAEDTPRALIAALRPDLLVKGADYTRDSVVGADIVEARGGRVLLADLQPGHSTSGLIADMGPG